MGRFETSSARWCSVILLGGRSAVLGYTVRFTALARWQCTLFTSVASRAACLPVAVRQY